MKPTQSNIELESISPEDFEFLCEDILRAKGFTIEARPARGPDGGKDLIGVRDVTDDIGFATRQRWLVECKHYIRSGRSVTEKDLGNVELRMKRHAANRYLLVTSTAVSETVKEQLRAITDDGATPRQAGFWAKSDLLKLLATFPEIQNRHFWSWEKEAREAAELFEKHYFEVHRGAILWCPGVTAVFGNDGYAPKGHELNEPAIRAQNEVRMLRGYLKEREVDEIAFNTTPDGYTWVILADTSDAPCFNEMIWTFYPPGGSSNQYTKAEAFGFLWKFLQLPLKDACPQGLSAVQHVV